MARRMSNRDRIERMREERTAADREKASQEPKRGARARPSEPARLVLAWAVKDGSGTVVATYSYPRKDAAYAEAARLKVANQRDYIVTPHKIPFDG